MAEHKAPVLWSDFDGTVVEKLPKWKWRNWTKWPLKPIGDFPAFVSGARSSGLEFGGFVSPRPELRLRRAFTDLSLADIGMRHLVSDEQVIHAGSENSKANVIVEKALERPLVFLEDRPHILVPFMIRAALAAQAAGETLHRVVVGAIEHKHSAEHMKAIYDNAATGTDVTPVLGSHYEQRWTTIHRADNLRALVTILPVGPYSYVNGTQFAHQVQGFVNTSRHDKML